MVFVKTLKIANLHVLQGELLKRDTAKLNILYGAIRKLLLPMRAILKFPENYQQIHLKNNEMFLS